MVKKEVLEPTIRADFETVVIDRLLLEDPELRKLFEDAFNELLEGCSDKKEKELDSCITKKLPDIEDILRAKYKERGYL